MLPLGAMHGQGTLGVRGRKSTGPLRGQPAAGPRRLVVKLGSSLRARPDGLLEEASLCTRRGDAALRAEGRAVLVVSSRGVAASRARLPDIAARISRTVTQAPKAPSPRTRSPSSRPPSGGA